MSNPENLVQLASEPTNLVPALSQTLAGIAALHPFQNVPAGLSEASIYVSTHIWATYNTAVEVAIHVKTQAEAALARDLFRQCFPSAPGAPYEKTFSYGTWIYRRNFGLVNAAIHVMESPMDCTVVEVEETVVERVPVAWEMKSVTKKVLKSDCGGA